MGIKPMYYSHQILWCDALPIDHELQSPWEQVVGRKGKQVLVNVLGAHIG